MLFQLETSEQSYAGSDLILQAIREMRKTYSDEKIKSNISQQKIANKLGLKHRSIVNRWLLGKENMSLRSIGELAWAMNRRAVITFEKLDTVNGNYLDDQPHTVSVDIGIKQPSVSNANDIWKRAKPEITKFDAVLENV